MVTTLERWYEEIVRCNRCGFCQATCPLYKEERDEASVARGRLRLIRAVADGQLSATEGYAARIYRCLLCAGCTATCPSGVEVDAILLAAREDLARRGAVPPALRELGQRVEMTHNISGEDNRGRLIWSQNLERAPLGLAPRAQAEVVYFVGCVSSFFPSAYGVAQSFTGLLEAVGVDYALMGGEEWCCGYPLLLNGMVDEARALMEHNVAQVKALGARQVVTTCPSCYYTWRHLYGEVAGEAMNIEVLHEAEWLASMMDEGRLALGELPWTVTYHDPCDLGRRSGLYDPPRQVLQRIPGLSLLEMADNRANALCCGGGGNLETYAPALVEAVARRRLAQAQDAGAEVIVSACPQCQRTLAGAARKERIRIRALDLSQVVWRAMQAAAPR